MSTQRLPLLARLTRFALFSLALLSATPAFAHHGWAAFEADRYARHPWGL